MLVLSKPGKRLFGRSDTLLVHYSGTVHALVKAAKQRSPGMLHHALARQLGNRQQHLA